ncbi:MAG: ATP-binding protein [Solirubrobacterales bacterium]
MTALPRPSSPGAGEVLVGREAELQKLEAFLAGAVAGQGAVIFLTGEAGIGKSALAGEFLRRAAQNPQVSICRGRCVDQYGAGEAYLPFLDSLGTLLSGPGREQTLAVMTMHAPTWCLQVPAATTSPEEREALQRRTLGATKDRMLREVVDGLSAAAARLPVVLLLEDLQWADPSSIDALRFMGKRLARQRILILGTFRPADVEISSHPLKSCRLDLMTESHCHEIALSPLGPAHVAEYLDARFPGHRFPAGLATFVHGRTEGHPLFVVSIVDLLAARGDIAPVDGASTLVRPLSDRDHDVPESLRDMIRRKVEMLGEADRTALQAASVIGRDFLSTVLASVIEADEEALEERLVRLHRMHGLVESRGEEDLPDGSLATRYRFTHALYHKVLYEELVSKRRSSLHLRVGQVLLRHYGDESSRVAAALALHFERGRDFPGALTALMQAGEKAAGIHAYGEALEHFGHAAELVKRLPAEEQAGRLLHLHHKRGRTFYDILRFDDAAADFTLMREAAIRVGDTTLEHVALSGLCNALFFTLRLEEMAVRAHEALGVAARSGSRQLQAEALVHVAQVVEAEGRLSDSLPVFDEVIEESRRIGHEPSLLSALAYRGLARYWQSEYTLAEEAFVEAAALAERLREGYVGSACRMHVGLARGNQGRFGAARAVFDEAIEMARRNGDRVWLPRLVTHLGWIHRELFDFDRAREYDEEGLRLAREQEGEIAPATEALLSLCVDYARAGRGDEALGVIQELEKIRNTSRGAWFGWVHELRMQSVGAEHWLLRKDLARAREHALLLRQAAEKTGARSYLAAAHRFLALAALEEGRLGPAREEAEAALLAIAGCRAPLEAWKVHATHGQALARAGEREAALAAWREAAALVRTIAAGVGDEALRERFLRCPPVLAVLDGAASEPRPV